VVVDFSVIIPTRNRPQYLAQAVASVLGQTGVELEVVVVDDGTTALPAFPDARVSIIDNNQRGPVPARNLGVANAGGEFIAFLDDDDWWLKRDFLSRSLKTLRSESDFSFADGTLVFEDGSTGIAFAFDANAKSLETNNTILISGVCYARALHDTLGGFDERLPYYWDWDWYLRVARSGIALTRLAEPLVAIRVHGGNMSNAEQEKARRNNLSALETKHGLAPLVLKNHLSLASE
jgi:glycosyltransferase involved in cell wall biosynthesis